MALPLGLETDRYNNIRKLAHVSLHRFPNDKMLDLALRGDTDMEIATNKATWTSTDAEWQAALKISDYYAAIEIVDGLPNEDATSLKDTLKLLVDDINRTGDSSAASTLQVSNTKLNIANELDPAVYTLEQDVFKP